ncbi:MAG: hypothetical protein HQK88_02730 [Nitrospirae bacterium]|nr:hypothetical protein [Nitrospirota bacterium]MBF0534306.1 hypothetical protein [Nitrospirota bacterium]MBF0615713.1 hypothetical protein [Nitrospirota bacterium]
MKTIALLVNKGTMPMMSFSLKGFEKIVDIRYVKDVAQLMQVFSMQQECCMAILETKINETLITDSLPEIRKKFENVKLLLIDSGDIAQEQIIELIRTHMCHSVVLKPFTAQKISDNIYTLCGFPKPSKSWYEHTKKIN